MLEILVLILLHHPTLRHFSIIPVTVLYLNVFVGGGVVHPLPLHIQIVSDGTNTTFHSSVYGKMLPCVSQKTGCLTAAEERCHVAVLEVPLLGL